MDIQTGKIYDVTGPDHLSKLENALGRKLVSLSENQAKELIPLSKRRRKFLLSGKPCICGSGKSFKKCCWRKYK